MTPLAFPRGRTLLPPWFISSIQIKIPVATSVADRASFSLFYLSSLILTETCAPPIANFVQQGVHKEISQLTHWSRHPFTVCDTGIVEHFDSYKFDGAPLKKSHSFKMRARPTGNQIKTI
ncbi:hypothetical protein Pdw03_0954 [Penicillium digitatum]|uniref:Uncharacterized protein n=1 Tax=Penicillium digitatum TaxID=36651 RepID=A0A7T7BNH3_PENDI|nr:hypothetical protein Pdw03_0954 [Penicillium digitatum]